MQPQRVCHDALPRLISVSLDRNARPRSDHCDYWLSSRRRRRLRATHYYHVLGHPWSERCPHGTAAKPLAWSLARHSRRLYHAWIHVSFFRDWFVASLASHGPCVVYHSQRARCSVASAVLSPATSVRVPTGSVRRGRVSDFSQRRRLGPCSESTPCESDLTRRWSSPLPGVCLRFR